MAGPTADAAVVAAVDEAHGREELLGDGALADAGRPQKQHPLPGHPLVGQPQSVDVTRQRRWPAGVAVVQRLDTRATLVAERVAAVDDSLGRCHEVPHAVPVVGAVRGRVWEEFGARSLYVVACRHAGGPGPHAVHRVSQAGPAPSLHGRRPAVRRTAADRDDGRRRQFVIVTRVRQTRDAGQELERPRHVTDLRTGAEHIPLVSAV